MTFLLYICNVACSSSQSACGKMYAKKGGNSAVFNINKAMAGILIFLLFGIFGGLTLHVPTLLYGIAYGVFLCISMQTGFMALAMGPMALTSIIASFSLIIPFLFGITVLKEALTFTGGIGMFFLLASILLLNLKKESGVSLKWFLLAFATLLVNGISSLIQKYHQIYFPGEYRTEFMLSAMATVLLILLALGYAKRYSPRPAFSFSGLGAASGILNGLANYLTLYLAATEKASVLFPVVSVANVIAVWLYGRFLFKEHLKPVQIAGLLCGITAILLLNLQR